MKDVYEIGMLDVESEESVTPMPYCIDYDDVDTAIEQARECVLSYVDDDRLIEGCVYLLGDNDRYCIHTISNKGKKETERMLRKMGYTRYDCDEYLCLSYWGDISAMLADTSEEEHMAVDIAIDTDGDNKSIGVVRIREIWQHPTEGIITYKIEGSDQEFDLADEDESIVEQVYVGLRGITYDLGLNVKRGDFECLNYDCSKFSDDKMREIAIIVGDVLMQSFDSAIQEVAMRYDMPESV